MDLGKNCVIDNGAQSKLHLETSFWRSVKTFFWAEIIIAKQYENYKNAAVSFKKTYLTVLGDEDM